jgi:hypothetical protein
VYNDYFDYLYKHESQIGEIRLDTTKLIDDIALFGSIHKDRKISYFLNRFYNNLSFIFAIENANIIKSYFSKYCEFRSRNLSTI